MMQVAMPSPRSNFPRAGFSVLEVMIAVCVLVMGVAAMLNSTFTLHQARQLAEEQNQLISLGRTLVERISTLSFEDLDNPATGGWVLARIKGSQAPGNLPPLRGSELSAFVKSSAILDGARVYIEYYRALRADADVKPASQLPGSPSLIEAFEADLASNPPPGATSELQLKNAADRFRSKFKDDGFRNLYLLNPSFNQAGQRVGLGGRSDFSVDDLVMVRVLVEWRERSISLYVTKRKEAQL